MNSFKQLLQHVKSANYVGANQTFSEIMQQKVADRLAVERQTIFREDAQELPAPVQEDTVHQETPVSRTELLAVVNKVRYRKNPALGPENDVIVWQDKSGNKVSLTDVKSVPWEKDKNFIKVSANIMYTIKLKGERAGTGFVKDTVPFNGLWELDELVKIALSLIDDLLMSAKYHRTSSEIREKARHLVDHMKIYGPRKASTNRAISKFTDY